jgi:ZIP family zinc transporter
MLLCLVAGLAEPVGGLIGWGVLAQASQAPMALAVLFSGVAGMMVYIALGELLPTAFKYDASGR